MPMAIIMDDKAQAAIARRRARGHDHTLFLRVERNSGLWGPAAAVSNLTVGWAPPICQIVLLSCDPGARR
jgi:hypothetical protein